MDTEDLSEEEKELLDMLFELLVENLETELQQERENRLKQQV